MDWERSGFWGLRGDGLVIIRKPIHTVKETETVKPKEKELMTALENRHESIDVIFTGPSIPSKVFSMADQITQLRCSK